MIEIHSDTNRSIIIRIMDDLELNGYVLDDMVFPRATVDPKLIKLQADVTEFVTSVVLKHEREFYQLLQKHFRARMPDILGKTGPSIIEMITESTNKFYNKLYYDIQHKNNSPVTDTILEMCEYCDYGAHILLDKLIRLTIETHLEVNREQLAVKDNDYDLYEKSVLMQINIYLLSRNLLHIMSKGRDEDTEFANIPEGESAFDISIDKNIMVQHVKPELTL